MSQIACEEIGWWMTTAFQTPEIRERIRALQGEQAPLPLVLDTLIENAPKHVGEHMRTEFAELPAVTLAMILQSWALADAGDKRFEVCSVRPEKPREFARARRVRVAFEAEETVVRVVVSHVASRHASWYTPGAVALKAT